MGFFANLFAGRAVDDAMSEAMKQMHSMAWEADRIYRRFLGIYEDEERRLAPPSGKGLFKARLHAATFIMPAFLIRHRVSDERAMELANFASGVSIEPLLGAAASPRFERNEASEWAATIFVR